jgi:chloramphenicol 3-O-phosphotransferase
MIIFFAGLPGVGKSSLAEAISKRFNIPYYPVDAKKIELYPALDPQYQYKIDNDISFAVGVKRKFFTAVAKDLERRASITRDIIVDDVLHRESWRKILFDCARTHFDGFIVFWVKTGEEIVKERLLSAVRKQHLLKDPWRMHLSYKNRFQDFSDQVIVFENNDHLDISVEKLAALITKGLSAA